MADFSKYFLMIDEGNPELTQKNVIEYTLLKTSEGKNKIDWDVATMTARIPKEHGNLNHVCRVTDEKGHKLYIKQAGFVTRISDDLKANVDRNKQESEILILEEKLVKGMVPHVFFYDTVMNACGMEDCSDYEVMRDAMLKHEIFPNFADEISTFLVNTLLLTSDVVMDHKKKKELTRRFITPDLDDITEKLVLMEPYLGADRNNVFALNRDFIENELYRDAQLHLEVAKLKFKFMNEAQALIHGDLHTGSIFIKDDGVKVFDCEFGTFGPMGYDIGNLVANMIFAYVNGRAYDEEEFCNWCLSVIEDSIDFFISKFNKEYDSKVTEPMAKIEGFKEQYLEGILSDTAGYAGTELHRRVVGLANVADLTSIDDDYARIFAERTCVLAGKAFIMNHESYRKGSDFTKTLLRSEERIYGQLTESFR